MYSSSLVFCFVTIQPGFKIVFLQLAPLDLHNMPTILYKRYKIFFIVTQTIINNEIWSVHRYSSPLLRNPHIRVGPTK